MQCSPGLGLRRPGDHGPVRHITNEMKLAAETTVASEKRPCEFQAGPANSHGQL